MKRKILKFLIIFILIIFITISLIIVLNKKIMPIYLNYSEIEIKSLVTTVINKSVNNIKFNDDLFILKNINGVVIVDYDPVVVNRIISDISESVSSNLKLVGQRDEQILKKFNINDSVFYIPTGVIFNSIMLNNIGPKIPVKLEVLSSINPSMETKVTEYGINNSLIEVIIKVNSSVKMLLPMASRDIDISVMVPLTVKIIQGNIPEYYLGSLYQKNSN